MFREIHPRVKRAPIRHEPQTGENSANVAFPESAWIQCSRCGYTLNRSRWAKGYGDGIFTAETQLNGAVTAGDATITVDSTTGFPTPSTASITAFAATRLGTQVTSASHGLKGGEVTITGTTNYNGTFPIQNVLTDTFEIAVKFVADDATGTWTVKEHFYVYDAGTYATSEDVSSAYTDATGAPRLDKVSYTGLTSTTFTGCEGALAHDDDMYVRKEPTSSGGCPFCGTFMYD